MADDLLIKIKVDADTGELVLTKKQVDQLGNSFATTSKKTKSFEDKIKSTALKVGGAVIAFETLKRGVQSYIATADQYSLVSGRLKLVTKSHEELLYVQKSLLNISNQSRVNLLDTVDTYSRIARSTKILGVTTEQTLGVTEAINKSLIVSGANAASANAALVQLGQGFASGALRGQELMSVMEQTPRLAEAIADGMGVTIGELRKLGEEGKLTADVVFNALLSQKEVIENEFKQLPKTIAQSNIVLGNTMTDFIGHFDEAMGITKALSGSILDINEIISTHRDEIIKTTKTVGLVGASILTATVVIKAYTAGVTLATTATALYGGTFGAVNRAIVLTTISTRALSLATKAIPFIAIASAIYAVSDALLTSSKNADTLNEAISTSGESLKNLTKNQLEYQKALIQTSISEAALELQRAKVDAASKTFFENDEEHKKDLALVDEKRQKFTDLKKVYFDIKNTLAGLNKEQKESNSNSNSTINTLSKQIEFAISLNKVEELSLKLKEEYQNKSLDLIIEEAEETSKLNSLLNQQSIEIENIATTALKNSEDAFLEYYESIGDHQKTWAIKSERILDKYEPLIGKNKARELAKIKKTEYFDAIEKLRTKDYEQAKADQKAYEFDQLKSYGTIADGFRYQFNEQMPTDFENGIELMKTMTGSLDDAWTSFFDRQSDSFGDFGDLAESILKDIEKQMIKTQLVQPLTTATSSLLSSVGGSLLDSLFDGWADGGYTYKASNDRTPVGVVHANEYVIPANMVRNHPSLVAGLEAERKGLKGFYLGGGANGTGDRDLDGKGGKEANTNNSGYDGEGHDKGYSTYGGTLQANTPTNNTKNVEIDFSKVFGKAIGALLGGLIGGPIGALLGGAVGGKIGDLAAPGTTSLGSFGLSSIESTFSGANTSNTNQVTNDVKSALDDYYEGGDGNGFGFNTDTTTQEVADIITELGTKPDVIEATSELFTSMIGSVPTVLDDANLEWNELFDAYIENGNSALLKTALDGSLFNTPDFYSVWETYATELNSNVEDVIKSSMETITAQRNTFTEFTFRNDELGLAQYQADYLTSAATSIASSLGVEFATLTSENFLDKYNEAMQESFTPETIASWNSLSDAFMSATTAQESFISAQESYIQSLEDAANALILTSNKNIKSFQNSFKTDEQLAADLATIAGQNLVTTYEELNKVFREMATDVDGLTDEELNYLNANKELIETQLNSQLAAKKETMEQALAAKKLTESGLSDYLNSIVSDISSLDSILGSLGGIINDLKSSIIGSSYSLENYYQSMKKTLTLSTAGDYEAYEDSLGDTISASSALFDAENFSSQYDQQFAQAVATNQFEGMETQAETQIDYLRQIEINTRSQLTIIAEQITASTNAIAQISTATQQTPDFTAPVEPAWGNEIGDTTANGAFIDNGMDKYINSLYLSIVGRSAEQAGLDYWSDSMDSGSLDNSNIVEAITNGAYASDGWTPQTSDAWIKSHGFKAFENGGHTGNSVGLVHPNEYVLNAETSSQMGLNNSSSTGVFSQLVTEIKELKKEMKILVDINANQARRIERIDNRDELAQRTA